MPHEAPRARRGIGLRSKLTRVRLRLVSQLHSTLLVALQLQRQLEYRVREQLVTVYLPCFAPV